MAKITVENRELFNTKMKPYKTAVDKAFEKEKTVLSTISKDSVDVEKKKYALAEEMIYISTLYLAINNLSVELLDTKNTDALNDARKTLYKAVIYLEEIVTNFIDASYSEYADKVEKLSYVPLDKKYFMVRKLGLAIRLLMDAYGDNTKWKWTFVELQGRYAIVSKNMLNLREAGKIFLNPSSDDYDTTVLYLRLIRKLISQTANGYRDKYELSTRRIDDMRYAINYLAALRRLCVIMNEPDEAEEQKKKAAVWKEKLESDRKKGICN